MARVIPFFNVSELLAPLDDGQLVLTANRRLASRIINAYGVAKRQAGVSVVVRPQVLSLESWLDDCWRQLLLQGDSAVLGLRVLSPAQELLLWQQVVEQSAEGQLLLRPAATAQQVASAYRTLLLWRLSISDHKLRQQCALADDTAALIKWGDSFQRRCCEQSCITTVERLAIIETAFNAGKLAAKAGIIGVGFDDLAPAHHRVIASAGSFSRYQVSTKPAQPSVLCCESRQQELYAAAAWAKRVLRDGPDVTVAIVVPDLNNRRDQVLRVLQEVFEMDRLGGQQARGSLPFNFSAGYSLLDSPMIAAAMDVFSLLPSRLEADTAYRLLRSPFYGLALSDNERISRLINAIADERSEIISSQRLRKLALQIGTAEDSDEVWPFALALQKTAETARRIGRQKQLPGSWSDTLSGLLAEMGWPGQRSLDTVEYQERLQWQQCLQQLATLDEFVGEVDIQSLVGLLRTLLANQVVQPESADSPLQILGTLEASGLQFDQLWLTSMSDAQWPPSPSPNPFLPYALQCENAMPHADAERELIYARQLVDGFLANARQVVVSYSAMDEGSERSVSPLFAHYPVTEADQLLGKSLDSLLPMVEIRRRHLESKNLEQYQPMPSLPLAKDEKISGGSSVFASQSACPFRAFVRHRLHVSAMAEPQLGLNAAERGSLLHRALELIWTKLKTRNQLLNLSAQEQETLCREASEFSLNELVQRSKRDIGSHFQALENNRSVAVLTQWLDYERERADFEIDQLEYHQQFKFAELSLDVRIDRIDKLASGQRVLIDYKTGKTGVNRWWGNRPDDPQLPLYTVLLENGEERLEGLAYAEVRIDNAALKGTGAEDIADQAMRWNDKTQSASGARDWPQLKKQWEKTLSVLAQDFINGKASVDPKSRNSSCQYCDLASVCRIDHVGELSA